MKTRVAVLTLMLAGCVPNMDGAPCSGDADCPSGQTCQQRKDGQNTGFGECRVKNDGQPFVGDGGAGGGAGTTGGGAGTTGGGDATTGGGDGTTGGGDGTTGGGDGVMGGGSGSDGGASFLTAEPQLVSFGAVVVGQPSSQSVTINNPGTESSGTLAVSISGAASARFVIGNNTCNAALAEDGSCTVEIIFTPNSTSGVGAQLDIAASPGGPLSVPLTGVGKTDAMLALSPLSWDAGFVALGGSATQHFTVINNGGVPSGLVAVSQGGASSGELSIINRNCTSAIDAGATCEFDAVLTPTTQGGKSASLAAFASPGGGSVSPMSAFVVAGASLAATPESLDFGGAFVGDAGVLSVTIKNTGGVATPLLDASAGASNDYTVLSHDCGVLQADAGCTVNVRFTPQSGGTRSGQVTVSGGALSKAVPLTGLGLLPATLTLTPDDHDFGTIANTSTVQKLFTLENTGDVATGALSLSLPAARFSFSEDCPVTLGAHVPCTVTVTYSPNGTTESVNTTLTVSAPGTAAAAQLHANAIQPSGLTINPPQYDFGGVLQGADGGTQTFTITNNNASIPLGVVSTSVVGTGYTKVSSDCPATLAGGASCVVLVNYAATAADRGSQVGTLILNGATTAALSATALKPATLTVSADPFPPTPLGSSSDTQLVTVLNDGDVASGVVTVTATLGADFTLIDDPCSSRSLPAGTPCSLRVTFNPTGPTPGPRSGNVVASATPGGAPSVTLSGQAVLPAALAFSSSPGSNFGNAVVGAAPVQRDFVLVNNGGATSGAITWSLAGSGYSQATGVANQCVVSQVLGAGASCVIPVVFTATTSMSSGAATGTLTTSASPGGAPALTLSANVQYPAKLVVDRSSVDFGVVAVTDTDSEVVELTNDGDLATSTLTLGAGVAPFDIKNHDCPTSLGPHESCTINYRYAPTVGQSTQDLSTATTSAATGGSVAVTLRGQSGWLLTVNNVIASGGGTPAPNTRINGTINCSGTLPCNNAFPHGSAVELVARTYNGSDMLFRRWSSGNNTAPSCTGYGVGTRCTVPMTASRTVTAEFAPNPANIGFVTSVVVPANLGVAGYNTLCNNLASDAGIAFADGGGYVAWLSTDATSAASVWTNDGGVVRTDGLPFTLTRADLNASRIIYPMNFDELGRKRTENSPVWTGTSAAGAATGASCTDWSGTGTATTGAINSGPIKWTQNGQFTCGGTGRVYCFQKRNSAAVPPPTAPSGSKIIYVSSSTFDGSNVDAACAATYSFYAASAGVAASSVLNANTTYVRIDNAIVGTGSEIAGGNLRTGIWVAPGFAAFSIPNYLQPTSAPLYVYSGATNPTVAPAAGSNTHCLSWTTAASSSNAAVGSAESSAFSFGGVTLTCNTQARAYCAQQ